MNQEEIEKEFIEKSKTLSFELIRMITKNTEKEGMEMSLKISLLALSKVAASVLYQIQRGASADDVVDLFLGTVVESLRSLKQKDFAYEEAQDIIDKLRGKQ